MAMYFVQHGKAVPKEIDSDRPLSEEGRAEVERVDVHASMTSSTIWFMVYYNRPGYLLSINSFKRFTIHMCPISVGCSPGNRYCLSPGVFSNSVFMSCPGHIKLSSRRLGFGNALNITYLKPLALHVLIMLSASAMCDVLSSSHSEFAT